MTRKEKVQMCIGLAFASFFVLMVFLNLLGVISFGFMIMFSMPIFLILGIGAQIIYGMKF